MTSLPSYPDPFWDRMAQQPIAQFLVGLARDNRCLICRYREPDGWLTKHPGEVVPLATMIMPLLVHLKTTHGIEPQEMLDGLAAA